MKRPQIPIVNAIAASADVSSDEDDEIVVKSERQQVVGGKRHSGTVNNLKHHRGSKGASPSPLGSAHSFDLQVRKIGKIKIEIYTKKLVSTPDIVICENYSATFFCRSQTGAWKSSKWTQNPVRKKNFMTVKVS